MKDKIVGIYCILNKINGKVYIGKSKDVHARLWSHKNLLKKDTCDKNCNRFLYNSVKKYGLDNFEFKILERHSEYCPLYLCERELYFMVVFNSLNQKFGYNLRSDYDLKHVVHNETKKLLSVVNSGENNPNYGNYWSNEQKQKMSKIAKNRHSSGVYGDDWKQKLSLSSKEIWSDLEKRAKMAKKVSESASRYRFYQYDKVTNELVRVWESISEIQEAHPEYHIIAIYGVCSGTKKSYRGFIWKKEIKR